MNDSSRMTAHKLCLHYHHLEASPTPWVVPPTPPHLSQSTSLHSKHVPVRSSCCCSGTTLRELLIYKDIEIMENHVRSRILTIRKSIKGPLPEYISSPIIETYGLGQWAWNFIVHYNYLGSLWEILSPGESQRFWIHQFTVIFRNMYLNKCQKGFQIKWSKGHTSETLAQN